MKELSPIFLTLAEIIAIHQNQIELYGGQPGIRDISLLSSAISMPESTFDGDYLHDNLFKMAAAYAFHICQNHPFIDGNKRVALVAALIFLDINGIEIDDPHGDLYKLMLGVASGKKNKENIVEIFKKLTI